MSGWTFWDFTSEIGTNLIRSWLDSKEVPKLAKAKINGRIQAMQGLPKIPEGWVSAYTGYPHLFELRIRYLNVQYRPLGFYGPKTGRWRFTILSGAIEKDDKIPRAVLDATDERRKIVINDPSRAIPHDFG